MSSNTRIMNGYMQIETENGDWKFLHRIVAEEKYGFIPFEYEVHHVNGDKLDNRSENLIVLSKIDHRELHNKPNDSGDSYIDYGPTTEKIDGVDWYLAGGMPWAPKCNID